MRRSRQSRGLRGDTWRIAALSGVTAVMITAEPTAKAHMPIMPVTTVPASAHHQM